MVEGRRAAPWSGAAPVTGLRPAPPPPSAVPLLQTSWGRNCAESCLCQCSFDLVTPAKIDTLADMGLTKISLSKSLRTYVDQQVAIRGYCTSGEFVRDLIRREKDREFPSKLAASTLIEEPE